MDAAAAVVEAEDLMSTSPAALTSGNSIIRILSQPVEPNSSFHQLGLMNEDEALRLILGATPRRSLMHTGTCGKCEEKKGENVKEKGRKGKEKGRKEN